MEVVVPPDTVAVKVEASPEHTSVGFAAIVTKGLAFTVKYTGTAAEGADEHWVLLFSTITQ
jgi:hypothetical protein